MRNGDKFLNGGNFAGEGAEGNGNDGDVVMVVFWFIFSVFFFPTDRHD